MTALELAKALLACPSLTPNEAGTYGILRELLESHGFQVESIDKDGVSNLWATHGESLSPLFCLAGHVDVVPTGPLEQWISPPFEPTIRESKLFARGAADMKGSIAAMVWAACEFVRENPSHPGTLAILTTSDEEGPAEFGTRHVLDTLKNRGVRIDAAIVGEPTCENILGDTIKVGRRGSVSGKLQVIGRQGHVAYPHLGDNPIHKALPFLTELTQHSFDTGNENFAPTSLQISNIHAGTGATNVIPGELIVDFNLRHSSETTPEKIVSTVEEMARRHGLCVNLTWSESANVFVTKSPDLIKVISNVIHEKTGVAPQLSTGGGTSDARFFAKHGVPVIEFGPLNATIHAVNEHIGVDELDELASCFLAIVHRMLSSNSTDL